MPISEYLANIRSLVGHRELCLPAVTGIIRNPVNDILFVKNFGDTLWTLPGGLVEPVESPAFAIVREISEELNVTLKIESLLGVFSGAHFRVVYPNKDRVVFVTSVFELTVDSNELTPDGIEIEEAVFMGTNDIEKLTVPAWVKEILVNREKGVKY